MDNTTIKEESVTEVSVKEYEFSGFVRGFLIFMLISSGINSISKFLTNLTWGNTMLGTIMFVCEMANVFFVIKIINKKGWGVLAFFGMLLLQIPMNLLLNSPDLESIYISTFVRIILFSIILLIPNKGVTGWRVLFGNKAKMTEGKNEDAIPSPESLEDEDVKPQEERENTDEQPLLSPDASSNVTMNILDQERSINSPEKQVIEPLPIHIQESPNNTESVNTANAEPEDIQTASCSVHQRNNARGITIPRWTVIIGCALIIALIIAFVISLAHTESIGTHGHSAIEKNSPTDVVFQQLDNLEDEFIISETDLARNRDNVAKIYSILKEEGYTDLGKNVDEFASMMSMVTNRKLAYELMNKEYDMGTFESFDARFYPATEEHLIKEKDRRWFYKKLKEEGLVVGAYDTFCTLLCYDEDLQNFYNQGIKAGLNLGTYEEYKKYIR